MPPDTEWLADTWGGSIKDRPEKNIWQYAADEIVFTKKMGNQTGPYDPWLTPYTLLFQEAITNDFSNIPEEDWWLQALMMEGRRVDEFFFVKSSQSGVTQGALNGCIYIPQFAPGRLLYILPSVEKAKSVVKNRLLPLLLEKCATVMEDTKDVNLTMIDLVDMIMEFGGSFSSGIFSEKPLQYGFLDDLEYMVSEGGVSGILDGVHVIDHIRSRFTTADEKFLAVFSKPDLESSQFISNYLGGSLHAFHVRCPLCGELQVLEPEGLFYDKPDCKDSRGRFDLAAVEALTTYRCSICRNDFEESHKYEMNKAGIYIPKSMERRERDDDPPMVPGRLSARISDLNSPFPNVRWGKLARMKIEADKDPEKLKYLVTNHWARPWRQKAVSLKSEQIKAVCAGAIDPKTGKHYPDDLDHEGKLKVPVYRRGQIPFKPDFLSITSDVQGDKYVYGFMAWKLDGTAALVDYGATLAESDLEELVKSPVSTEGKPFLCLEDGSEGPWAIDGALIDSGNDAYAIYDFCIRTGWAWYPSKGVAGITMTIGGKLIEGKQDFYEGQEIIRYHYNDYALKRHFYHNKLARAHDPKNKAARLYLPIDIDEDFILQLTSESLGPGKKNPKILEWFHDKTIAPNDDGDMMKMHFGVWQIVGPLKQAEAKARELQAAAAKALGGSSLTSARQ